MGVSDLFETVTDDEKGLYDDTEDTGTEDTDTGSGSDSDKGSSEDAEEHSEGKEKEELATGEQGAEGTDKGEGSVEDRGSEEGDGSKEEFTITPSGEEGDLKALVRDQRRRILALEARANEKVTREEKAGSSESDDDAEFSDEELDDIDDEDDTKDQQGGFSRADQLGLLVETMRLSDRYGDVDEVVSQKNMDDLVESLALREVKLNGGQVETLVPQIEAYIWSQANPYRFAYDLIKKAHPDYAKKESSSEVRREPVKAPPSVADMGGTGADTGGWTMAKVDAMDESELHKVPPAVYEKWLANELK